MSRAVLFFGVVIILLSTIGCGSVIPRKTPRIETFDEIVELRNRYDAITAGDSIQKLPKVGFGVTIGEQDIGLQRMDGLAAFHALFPNTKPAEIIQNPSELPRLLTELDNYVVFISSAEQTGKLKDESRKSKYTAQYAFIFRNGVLQSKVWSSEREEASFLTKKLRRNILEAAATAGGVLIIEALIDFAKK